MLVVRVVFLSLFWSLSCPWVLKECKDPLYNRLARGCCDGGCSKQPLSSVVGWGRVGECKEAKSTSHKSSPMTDRALVRIFFFTFSLHFFTLETEDIHRRTSRTKQEAQKGTKEPLIAAQISKQTHSRNKRSSLDGRMIPPPLSRTLPVLPPSFLSAQLKQLAFLFLFNNTAITQVTTPHATTKLDTTRHESYRGTR